MKKKARRVSPLKSEKSRGTEENPDDISEDLSLSEEARLTPQQEEQIEELGDNRFLISTSEETKEESDEEEKERRNSETKGNSWTDVVDDRQDLELFAEKTAKLILEKLKGPGSLREKGETDLSSLSDPQKLVKLLSSYNVSPSSSIEDLIREIKRRGREHLEKELKKILNG